MQTFVSALKSLQLCRDSCSGVVVVGALTKPSRSADLCARRILHLNAMDGVLHVPVSPAMRLAEQALLCVPATAHVLLVKATDFMGVDASGLPVFDEQLQQVCMPSARSRGPPLEEVLPYRAGGWRGHGGHGIMCRGLRGCSAVATKGALRADC